MKTEHLLNRLKRDRGQFCTGLQNSSRSPCCRVLRCHKQEQLEARTQVNTDVTRFIPIRLLRFAYIALPPPPTPKLFMFIAFRMCLLLTVVSGNIESNESTGAILLYALDSHSGNMLKFFSSLYRNLTY